MVLFEIHQRFKGHFLNELRVSFKEHIPRRMLSKFTFEKEIEAFPIEINLRKVKWLLICSHNPNICNLPVHLNAIDKVI